MDALSWQVSPHRSKNQRNGNHLLNKKESNRVKENLFHSVWWTYQMIYKRYSTSRGMAKKMGSIHERKADVRHFPWGEGKTRMYWLILDHYVTQFLMGDFVDKFMKTSGCDVPPRALAVRSGRLWSTYSWIAGYTSRNSYNSEKSAKRIA